MVTYNTLVLDETEGMRCSVTPTEYFRGLILIDVVALAYDASTGCDIELFGMDEVEASDDVRDESRLDGSNDRSYRAPDILPWVLWEIEDD